MTSEEYARQVGMFMLSVARDQGVSREHYAYRRLFSLAATRIMFQGKDEYAERDDTVQLVETKPLPALVQDIEEEITDLTAYAVALSHRLPEKHRDACEEIVFLAMQMMELTGKMREDDE